MAAILQETLTERGQSYGRFADQAAICQSLKHVFQRAPSWSRMEPDQRECLDMLANKVGRVLNGDPNHIDSWLDMAGYAMLVVERLKSEVREHG